jgi:Domain of unknown function (DUF1905)
VKLEFSGRIWFWRGPAPWYFVTVPEDESESLRTTAAAVSYGWGMIPVKARIGDTQWDTALWPKDERYVVPLKSQVRRAEALKEDATVTVQLAVDV